MRLLILLYPLFVYSQTCVINKKDITVEWYAFKTPSKIGVKGWFKNLGLNKSYKGNNLKGLLTGTKFNIKTDSTDTGVKERNKKIVDSFFGKIPSKNKNIRGSIVSVTEDTLNLELTINNVTRQVPMNFKESGNEFLASGYIDVFDFGLMSSLKGINEACKALHLGKTWNDVKLVLKAKYSCK